jgi:hypothetical protein
MSQSPADPPDRPFTPNDLALMDQVWEEIPRVLALTQPGRRQGPAIKALADLHKRHGFIATACLGWAVLGILVASGLEEVEVPLLGPVYQHHVSVALDQFRAGEGRPYVLALLNQAQADEEFLAGFMLTLLRTCWHTNPDIVQAVRRGHGRISPPSTDITHRDQP